MNLQIVSKLQNVYREYSSLATHALYHMKVNACEVKKLN